MNASAGNAVQESEMRKEKISVNRSEEEDAEKHMEEKEMSVTDDEEEKEEEEEDEKEEEANEAVVDVKFLRDAFSPGAEGEVPLHSYLAAFQEMNKFIKNLGPLFHFIAFDVKRKMKVLREYMASKEKQHYVDVRTMMEYEIEKGMVHQRSPYSGTMALIRLHRGLGFTSEYMKELLKEDEDEEESLAQATSRLYQSMLARFHSPMLARGLAGLLLMMSDRATIRNRAAKGNEELLETMKKDLPEVIKAVTATHQACHELYRRHDLLDLK